MGGGGKQYFEIVAGRGDADDGGDDDRYYRGDNVNNPLRQRDFVEAANRGLREWRVPGLSVAVVDGDDDVWAEGFGFARLPSRCTGDGDGSGDGDGVKATKDTLWYAGSTTKAFTAAVLGQMIHPSSTTTATPIAPSTTATGNTTKSTKSAPAPADIGSRWFPRGWRTPISSVIRDDFVLSDEWASAHVTFEDALSHRTGLARHDKALADWYFDNADDAANNNKDGHRATIRDYTRLLRHLPLVLEPRVAMRYCNLMFLAVSHAIETVTGDSWLGDVMHEWIWEPLGMRSTFLSLQDAQREQDGNLAHGYYWDYDGSGLEEHAAAVADRGVRVAAAGAVAARKGRCYHDIPNMDLSGGSGAGGIISSVADYALWMQCLLGEGKPLSKECHRAIKTPRVVTESNVDAATGEKINGYDGPLTYCLAWYRGTYKGHTLYTHSGGMEAYGTQLYLFPDIKYGIVTMGNTAVSSNALGETLAWRLIDDKLGVPESERWDWAAKRRKGIDRSLKAHDTAMQDLFPHRAKPPVRRALSLEEYTGTYFHPAYQKLVIIRNDKNIKNRGGSLGQAGDNDKTGELYAAQHDRVWKMDFEFEHVSGEHWLVCIDFTNSRNKLSQQFARAEFKVGPAGKAEAIRVEYMEDGDEGAVEYKKIA